MIGWFLIYHCLQERCSELTCKMHMLALAGLFMTKIPWFREFDFTSVSFSAWDFRFSECLKGSICLPRQDKWLSKKQIQGISIKSVSGERLPCWHRESISQMQGTWVWSLVWEDPTCHRATKPVNHNYWAPGIQTTREPVCLSYWRLHSLEPTRHNQRICAPQQRPWIMQLRKTQHAK